MPVCSALTRAKKSRATLPVKLVVSRHFFGLLALLTTGCSILDRQGLPTIRSLKTNYGEQPSVGRGKEVVLTILATDPDNDELDFTWTAIPLSGAATGGGKFRNPRTPVVLPRDTLMGVFQDTVSIIWEAPAVPDAYLLRLRITDGRHIRTDSLIVRVTQRPPLADAGRDQPVPYVDAGIVTLDGTRSVDPDEDDLTYVWIQVGGPGVSLTNERTGRPVFRPPAAGDYRFRLRVFDGADSSEVALVVIRISDRGGG